MDDGEVGVACGEPTNTRGGLDVAADPWNETFVHTGQLESAVQQDLAELRKPATQTSGEPEALSEDLGRVVEVRGQCVKHGTVDVEGIFERCPVELLRQKPLTAVCPITVTCRFSAVVMPNPSAR